MTQKCECETSCNDAFYDIGTNTMPMYPHNLSIDPFTYVSLPFRLMVLGLECGIICFFCIRHGFSAGTNDSNLIINIKLGRQVYRGLSKELLTNILSLAC